MNSWSISDLGLTKNGSQFNSFKLQLISQKNLYSVSCDLPATPAPGQSTGPGTRPALTAKRPAHTGLIKVIINTFNAGIISRGFNQCRSCAGTGTLLRCRCRGKTARNTVLGSYRIFNLKLLAILLATPVIIFIFCLENLRIFRIKIHQTKLKILPRK